jgi:hypothetical protein
MFCIAQPVIVYVSIAFFVATLFVLIRGWLYKWELTKSLTSKQKGYASKDRKTTLHFYMQGAGVGVVLILLWKFLLCT